MKKSIGTYKGDKLYLSIGSYRDNGRIYIGIDTNKESYSNLTINLSNLMIPDDNYIFVSGDMARELRNFLEKKGIVSEALGTYQYNMGRYDIAKVDFNKLKEYDPKGFKEFNDMRIKRYGLDEIDDIDFKI